MFMVEIDGMRLLYTGDYSRAADRHMSAADLPSPKPHIGALFPSLCHAATALLVGVPRLVLLVSCYVS